MSSPDDVMSQHFPAYMAGNAAEAWKVVEASFRIGDSVTGKVVAKFHFGLAIDFGAPLPGVLLATRIPGVSAESLDSGPRYRLGANITARVERFAKDQQQIALSQLPSDEMHGR